MYGATIDHAHYNIDIISIPCIDMHPLENNIISTLCRGGDRVSTMADATVSKGIGTEDGGQNFVGS